MIVEYTVHVVLHNVFKEETFPEILHNPALLYIKISLPHGLTLYFPALQGKKTKSSASKAKSTWIKRRSSPLNIVLV